MDGAHFVFKPFKRIPSSHQIFSIPLQSVRLHKSSGMSLTDSYTFLALRVLRQGTVSRRFSSARRSRVRTRGFRCRSTGSDQQVGRLGFGFGPRSIRTVIVVSQRAKTTRPRRRDACARGLQGPYIVSCTTLACARGFSSRGPSGGTPDFDNNTRTTSVALFVCLFVAYGRKNLLRTRTPPPPAAGEGHHRYQRVLYILNNIVGRPTR